MLPKLEMAYGNDQRYTKTSLTVIFKDMIYIILFFLFFIPAIFYDLLKQSKGRNFVYVAECVILILFVGLRFRVGGDTLYYMEYFLEYPSLLELHTFDFSEAPFNPLWYILNALCISIYDDFITFQLVHALIVNVTFFWFFNKYSTHKFSLVVLYFFAFFCYYNMEILREILPICIFMISWQYLITKKWLQYFGLSLLALGFHSSALILFLYPFILLIVRKASWLRMNLYVIVILIITYFINGNELLQTFVYYFFDDGVMGDKLEHYSNLGGANLVGTIYIYIYMCIPILILIWLQQKYNIESNEKLFGAMLLLLLFQSLRSLGDLMFIRFSNYLQPFFLVYLVNTFYHIAKFTSKTSIARVLVLYVLLWFSYDRTYYYVSDRDISGAHFYFLFDPYYTVFNPIIDNRRELFLYQYREI